MGFNSSQDLDLQLLDAQIFAWLLRHLDEPWKPSQGVQVYGKIQDWSFVRKCPFSISWAIRFIDVTILRRFLYVSQLSSDLILRNFLWSLFLIVIAWAILGVNHGSLFPRISFFQCIWLIPEIPNIIHIIIHKGWAPCNISYVSKKGLFVKVFYTPISDKFRRRSW